jgi:hypothetical protein
LETLHFAILVVGNVFQLEPDVPGMLVVNILRPADGNRDARRFVPTP